MKAIVFAFVLLIPAIGSSFAETANTTNLKVGVYERQPFVVKEDHGEWEGLAIALWRIIASRAELSYEFIEVDEGRSLDMLKNGELDVLLGQMNVTAARDRSIDFSHAFLVEPLAAAIPRHLLYPHWMEFVKTLPSHGLFSLIGVSFLAMMVFAILFWLAERGRVNSHFEGHPLHALGSALWFSAVTMTTVGYGDKTPLTPVGRILAFIWMFVGILLVGGFTATVASTVAASRMNASIFELSDLSRFETGVLLGSTAGPLLRNVGIPTREFKHLNEAMEAMQAGEVEAVASDLVTIRYALNQARWHEFRSATLHDASSSMAIPVRPGLPELDVINVELLETVEDPTWQAILRRWAGAPLQREF